jgi:HSP90 family molecular chaperone
VLEVNLGHPLLRALVERKGSDTAAVEDASRLLLDLAQLAEGEAPENGPDLARRLSNWAARALAADVGE